MYYYLLDDSIQFYFRLRGRWYRLRWYKGIKGGNLRLRRDSQSYLAISVLSLWVLREATPEGIRVPEKTTSDCAGKVTRLAPDCIGIVTDASRDGTWVSAGLVPVTVWVVSDAVSDGTWVLTGETWVGNFVKTYAMHRA